MTKFTKLEITLKIVAVLPAPDHATNADINHEKTKMVAEDYIKTATDDLFKRFGPSVCAVATNAEATVIEA